MNQPDPQANDDPMIRHRRQIAHDRTPQQQAEISDRLQQTAMEAIRSDPAAYQAFMARNHRKRRISEVQKLEALMRQRCQTDE
ncbi:hypothetical protein LF1_28900 [Rubripirellula obstinata]|uniref:Uncharacterized protein n=1 Tax=Rubripirellula obstinata TaxID=406547 RepID=A0A5B1CLD7_9BACT|nr:hypothetical protein [Rubripirellula obstinata]KAA1260350.1 hypothetical protein LF1_28900 [Rubripirellula obstinata]